MTLKRSDSFEQVLAAMQLAKHRIELTHRQRVEKLMDDVMTWRCMYEDEVRSHKASIDKLRTREPA